YTNNSSPKLLNYYSYINNKVGTNTLSKGGYNLMGRPYISKRYLNTKSLPVKDITNELDIFNDIGIDPVIWWGDLNNKDKHSIIRNELNNKAGIYIIINKITRNCYIGSGSTNKLYNRFVKHLLNYKGSKLIKRSVLKYGLNNFIFAILEYYPLEINKYNNKELITLEKLYISLLMPEYNILTEAGNSFGYKHTKENIERFNLPFNNERKEMLKQLQLNNKCHKTNEQLLKLNNITLNRSSYITLSLNNKILCTIKGINRVANLLCCSYKTIEHSLKIGWIYIPDSFIPYLNNDFINNNNDIITHLPLKGNIKTKYKSTNINIPNHTMIYIKNIIK
ncbi:hypothetical protein, partial (mitochondrion) [Candida pseudojiufengensis]